MTLLLAHAGRLLPYLFLLAFVFTRPRSNAFGESITQFSPFGRFLVENILVKKKNSCEACDQQESRLNITLIDSPARKFF